MEFWKLEAHPSPLFYGVRELKRKLDEQGYYYKSSATKARLRDLLVRYDRGLLSYEKYTPKELKEFAVQRHLDIPTDTKKDVLVSTLEQADEDATFDRIFDLPPELRNHIYTLHFEQFSVCNRPITPPITQASRQLRQESLLLFYRTCITEISLSTYVPDPSVSYRRRWLGATDPLRPVPSTTGLFSRMPEDLLVEPKKV